MESDTSYMLGRYIGSLRKIEKELERMSRQEQESAIEKYFDEFVENPSDAMTKCQDAILKEQFVLLKVNRNDLVDESAALLLQINTKAVEYLTLDLPNFIHGYQTQVDSL